MKVVRVVALLSTLAAAAAIAACSSSSSGTPTPAPEGTQNAVAGPADMHCAAPYQVVSEADCFDQDAAPTDPDAGDAGLPGAYEATMYGSEGNDDHCKYHVTWESTKTAENQDVTFTIVVTSLTGAGPVTGLDQPYQGYPRASAEVYLNPTHPAPFTNQKVTATGNPGEYTIGPIQFDAPGTWTTRFHIHQECYDLVDDSPHGHAAFFVEVP
jgi:hypothetical protein